MFKNLLKIAFRNLLKDKSYTAINILGLTIGITSSVLILFYTLDETSYDKYHENGENIYRVVSNITEPDNAFTWAVAQRLLAPELLDKYPDVRDASRISGIGRVLFKSGDIQFFEEDFYTADSTVFDMFTYQFLEGDMATSLDNPNSIVLTESVAKKYFGNDSAIGETLEDASGDSYTVTGVMKNVPSNSHLIFDALISSNTNGGNQRGSWGNFGVFTYILLPPNYDPLDMKPSFDSVIAQHVNPIFESIGITIEYELQRITDIHLHSKIQDEAENNGDITNVYLFTAVAIIMLIIASINYMNLATARSSKRAKEVGIRKVMGSSRGKLISQFLTESVVIALVALVVSIGLIYLLLPAFNNISGKVITFSYILRPSVFMAMSGMLVFIGIVSGSYPAFYLSGFKPVDVLKGRIGTKGGNVGLRKILVIVQFSISVIMLISTMVVYQQLQFLRSKDLGFNKDQVLRIELSSREIRDNFPAFKNELTQLPNVVEVGTASSAPGEGIGKLIMNVEDNNGEMLERGVDFFAADYEYLDALGMEIVAGRNFSRDFVSDTSGAALVNQAMVDRMAWEEPIGKVFEFGQDRSATVVGVIKDYHQNSLYNEIEPLMIRLIENMRQVFIKVQGEDIEGTMENIETAWTKVNPDDPFEYNFLDQDFNSQYDADQRRGVIFTIFSGLTLAIACLGLLGLTSFTTEQRTKEIGVRKVIGASVGKIVLLVSREFIVLVGISFVIAMPVAYYFMTQWLKSFAYKIELSSEWMIFVASALMAILITFGTVAFHTTKAAIANPINSLRDE